MLRLCSIVASSYGATSLVALIASGVLFVISSSIMNWDPLTSRQILVVLVVAGPVAGCLLTLVSRRLIDLVNRVAPQLALKIEPDNEDESGLGSKTILAIAAVVFMTVGLALMNQNLGLGQVESIPGCTLSFRC